MKRMKKYIGVIALGSTILLAPSCSDSWDDHYDAGQGTSATQSLWELISENSNLSNYAELAQKVHYYRDETHPQADYTFQNMLNGTQLLTVWAPENEALTSEEWQKWNELAETNPYTVQQQLLANSISLWRQVATGGGADTLSMLNGKKQVFDKEQYTMAGLPLIEKNLAATNGTLHTVGTPIPFDYNLYEYLKDEANASSNSLSTFHNVIIESDTTYFSESNSIEGNPDENGNPTYVDSVYYTTNTMFMGTKRFPSSSNTDQYLTYDESFGANIISEDSAFILILPTDAAWEQAYSKLEPYYNYAPIYVDNEKGNNGTKNVFREIENTDSLKEKCINMDILSPLCYNLNLQPNEAGKIGRWQMEDFLQNSSQATYFLNTYGDTLRSDDTWSKEVLLEGEKVKMSNGYGIVTDSWNIPSKLYKPDLTIEVGYQSFYNFGEKTGNATSFSFSNSTASEWIDSVGRVSKDNFYQIGTDSPSGNPKIEFKLLGTDGENRESEVMSGKYDIYLVMVPDFYITSTDTIEGDTVKHKIIATLSYCDGNTNGRDATAKSSIIEYNGEKVDSVLLFEDFEFPYSYKNLRQSYPTLMLTTKTSSSERKNGYSNTFCIDRIILKSKE